MKTKEYISFQSVDCEGDIWCNKALLFLNEEQVNNFFENFIDVITTLEIKLEDNENKLTCDYTIHRSGKNNNGEINCITFNCIYTDDVKIQRMSKGFLIN